MINIKKSFRNYITECVLICIYEYVYRDMNVYLCECIF